LGANAYRLYEAGEMPTVANGRLILSVREPEEFIKQVKASSHFLGEREVSKLISRAQSLIDQRSHVLYDFELSQITLREDPPNSYNGYRRLSLQRITQTIVFFEQHIGNLYKYPPDRLHI